MITNRKIRALVIVALVLASLPIVLQAHADEWRWSGVDRIVAVSDVHGAFGAMVATLTKAGVLDQELGWNGGETHLVITGDILDRGPDSRQVMDLLMRLEDEALTAGGRVHLLLGNHEVMNLIGDLRYVSKEEYAAFADDELPEDRKRWYREFSGGESDAAREASLRGEFAGKYPAGFFGLRRAFGSQGAYGPWLMSKPLLVVINGTAYVHGGMSPLVGELGLEGVNRELKSQVTEYVAQSELLFEEGLLQPTANFYAHKGNLAALPENASRPKHIQEAIDAIISGQEEIEFVFNTITIQLGPDTMLAAKIKMRDGMDIAAAVDSINALERELKASIPKLKWCFIEPDVAD